MFTIINLLFFFFFVFQNGQHYHNIDNNFTIRCFFNVNMKSTSYKLGTRTGGHLKSLKYFNL